MKDNILGLYDHNIKGYHMVKDAYLSGEKIAAILHATGTGKTLIALQLAYDNPDKQIIFVTPYNSIIEHIKELINDIPGIDINRDFGHVRFMTYSSLVTMSKEEIKDLNVDMLMLDEFHHIGAPVWGERVDTIIDTHPDLEIFGMSAYSVRDRGTSYERDLAEDDSDELFSGKVVSRYDLVDAMMDGVLPVPIYRSLHIKLLEFEEMLEKKVRAKYHDGPVYDEYMKKLKDAKRRIASSVDANQMLVDSVKKNGKYIYFCPPVVKDGVNDIDTIIKETREAFICNGYKEEDLVFYVTTSEDVISGKRNRKAFYNDVDLCGEDVSSKLRIMFAINQYNEGVHAPNVDGVILGRETNSDIVCFEQIGRALSVRGYTRENIIKYQSCSLVEIKELCLKSGIIINEYMTKDDMIERLVAPKIIDLAGNYSFIKDLITDLRHRIREVGSVKDIDRFINITEASFEVEMYSHDIFTTLMNIKNDFMPKSWDEVFELCKNYRKEYNHLKVRRDFKTDDGINYDEYGYALGEWISIQRKAFKDGSLSKEREDKLNSLGMVWNTRKTFSEAYKLAKVFYDKFNHLRINSTFKTEDGINYDKNGYSLGGWIANLRVKYKKGRLSKKEISMLNNIGMIWQLSYSWSDSYEMAKNFFLFNGHLNIDKTFRTYDGINYDKNGHKLGEWLRNQSIDYHGGVMSKEKIELLKKIKFDFSIVIEKKKVNESLGFDEMLRLATVYYEEYGHLNIPRSYVTEDGVRLGAWISRQRVFYKKSKLDKERIDSLNKIGMLWNESVTRKSFLEAYELASKYYLEYGNLNIKTDFKTSDGVNYDEDGYALGSWIYIQRKRYDNDELESEQIILLNKIGMIWSINKNYAMIKSLLSELGLNPRKYSKYVKELSFMEFEAKVKFLIANNIDIVVDSRLHEIFLMSDTLLLVKYGIDRNELVTKHVGLEKRY